jgi:serine/threonine protein kinase
VDSSTLGDSAALERVGKTLRGKWHLDALIGVGGMASVYAATHRNGARCAVKVLHQTEDPEAKGRFTREGYIANHVEHPSVVRVLDDDVAEDGSAFLVMERLEGKALDALAEERGGSLPVREVMRIAGEVLDVLAYAHARGIFHRDIKPENVFLTVDGKVKVLDFGIARFVDDSSPRSTQSRAGVVMGTPGFMSPEQARGRWDLVGVPSDVWSVGAMMFTLLSGQFVHDEENVPELLAAVFMKPARSLRDVLPDAPWPLVALVDRALQLRMADRWGNAREMHRALREAEGALDALELPLNRRPLRLTLPRFVVRSAALGAVALLIVATVVAAGAWRVDAAWAASNETQGAPPFARAPWRSEPPGIARAGRSSAALPSPLAAHDPIPTRIAVAPGPAPAARSVAPSAKGNSRSSAAVRRSLYDRRY